MADDFPNTVFCAFPKLMGSHSLCVSPQLLEYKESQPSTLHTAVSTWPGHARAQASWATQKLTLKSIKRTERARTAPSKPFAYVKLGADLDGSTEITKKETERERSRVNAAKRRRRKIKDARTLEDEYQVIAGANSTMKRQQLELHNQLTFWRSLAQQHNACDANCDAIKEYNLHQAFPNGLESRNEGYCNPDPSGSEEYPES